MNNIIKNRSDIFLDTLDYIPQNYLRNILTDNKSFQLLTNMEDVLKRQVWLGQSQWLILVISAFEKQRHDQQQLGVILGYLDCPEQPNYSMRPSVEKEEEKRGYSSWLCIIVFLLKFLIWNFQHCMNCEFVLPHRT